MSQPRIDKNTSLALKLNAKMFGLQFVAFLMLDIILISMLFIGSMIFMEKSISTTADDIESSFPNEGVVQNIETRGIYGGMAPISLGAYEINFSNDAPSRSHLDRVMDKVAPDNTKDGVRKFVNEAENRSFRSALKGIKYSVILPIDNMYMDVSYSIGTFYYYCFNGMIVLMIIQIIMLIDTALSTRKSVSKALEPLRELSQATQAFSDAANNPEGQYSESALRNLAQALGNINASHLDARIPSDLMAEELKPLAAAINQMLNRINESYDSQIRFVSDASHELRTPIAVIQGYADLLSRWGSEDRETLDESIQAIRSEAESMKQLVNQLLFLARGDADSMQLDWKNINLSLISSEVAKEMEMIDKIHELNIDVAPDIHVMGDQGLIKQLLRILTDNSIKYTPNGGKITIKLNDLDGNASITVQDEGVGIPEDVLPKIFERFVRADESRTRNTGGAGLGLSIAKWITEKHGGHLEVLSREGIGTRFTVVIPLSNKRTEPQQEESHDSAPYVNKTNSSPRINR